MQCRHTCPTSRCRVGGYRQRQLRGTFSTAIYAPYEERNISRGERAILRWEEQGVLVMQDAWCQAKAEAVAYDLMERWCADRRWSASTKQCKERMPWGITAKVVGPFARISVPGDARRVGLVIIPKECGGGAVLVTATGPE